MPTQTSTTSGIAISEFTSFDGQKRPAVTKTQPVNFIPAPISSGNAFVRPRNSQTTESHISEIQNAARAVPRRAS